MITILKQILFRRNCEDSEKMTLNLIMIQKWFWKDDIEKVKIEVMIKILKQILFRGNCEDSSKMILNLIVIQKRFWKDDIKKVKSNIMENWSIFPVSSEQN